MPGQSAASSGPLTMLVPFAMMFLIFYFLVFRPQSQARKEHDRMVKNLKKHDEVVTSGGMFGSVANVKPDAVTLRVDENVRIDVEPSAIVRLVRSSAKDEPASTEKRA